VIYKLNLQPLSPLASPPVSGFGSIADVVQFIPWQPSAWPEAPRDSQEFALVLKAVFEQSMLMRLTMSLRTPQSATAASNIADT